MAYHGIYFGNYSCWLEDLITILSSAQVVLILVGQEYVNAFLGCGFRGLHITAGLFSLWFSNGFSIITYVNTTVFVIGTLALLLALVGFYHMHIIWLYLYIMFSSFSIFGLNFTPGILI